MKLYFATTNKWKFKEAKELFAKYGIDLKRLNAELTEIQTNNVVELATISVCEAFKKIKKPVFVEDSGIFISALKGFPGVYSKYAYYTVGLKGILKLMHGLKDRGAYFQTVVAYKDRNGEKVFKAKCLGSIALDMRGREGFGFDPIFLPKGFKKTFAEDVRTKARLSHRVKALQKLANWLSWSLVARR